MSTILNKEKSVTTNKSYKVCRMIDDQDRIYELWLAPKSTEIECTWDEALDYTSKVVIGKYTDWVVPNRSELLQLWELLGPEHTTIKQFKKGNANAFVVGSYWSSTEYSVTIAWRQTFINGAQGPGSKVDNRYLRLVRRVYVD